MLLGTLGTSMLGNMLTRKDAQRAGKAVVRVGRGHNNMDHMDKLFSFTQSFMQYRAC